jgi:hypothetical protein
MTTISEFCLAIEPNLMLLALDICVVQARDKLDESVRGEFRRFAIELIARLEFESLELRDIVLCLGASNLVGSYLLLSIFLIFGFQMNKKKMRTPCRQLRMSRT